MKIIKISIILIFVSFSMFGFSQTVLTADGPGNTYELINSVLAPGATAEETPDQFDPLFGRHIAEVWDAVLNQYVFEFYVHVSVPNELQDEATGDKDRQRCEIKTYGSSPDNLKGTPGETVEYKWKFKLPTGFQPSSNFTHIHQIKAVGGDESDPIFTLTCRKGTPNKLELNYYSNSNLNSIKYTSANLSLFENTWVEATERIKLDSVHGTYSINIVKVSDGTKLLTYTNNNLLTYRATNTFIRPKWGIYRSITALSDLRDEAVRFNSFSITELNSTGVNSYSANENEFKVTPNSSSKTIQIQYYLPEKETVGIDIFSIAGQKIKTLIQNENQDGGNYQKQMEVSNLKSGIYLIRLQTSKSEETIKFIF
jgi:hypothetical protein